MPSKDIDQQAVADKLGISRSTVTRILRHDPLHRVSTETRSLVLATAREMGYKLRRRRTGNIAFVVCGELASAQHELHLATCEEAAKSEYRVFLVRMPDMPTRRQLSLYVNPLASDGAVIVGSFRPDVVAQLGEVMPVVTLDADPAVERVDNVTVDRVALGRALADRLISLGHTRIAVIAQFPEEVRWAGPIEGFRQACESADIEPELSMTWSKAGRLYPSLLAEILSVDPKPTALFALTTSDHAIILSTLVAMGVRVPEDMSYVGWAHSYMAALLPFPVVTCLDDVFESMARSAVGRLLDRAEDLTSASETIVAPVNVRAGETCVERK